MAGKATEIIGRNGETEAAAKPTNFIRTIIDEDLRQGATGGKVITRFPPEPNGYLHIGHAKSICLNFGLAKDYDGRCHLRFDDTNPTTEDIEYVESIQRDIQWLGFDWQEHLYFASDYFGTFYQVAETLVEKGLAYVDSLDEEAIREFRGTVTQPGKPSPYRTRSVEENLDLLRRMKAGEFAEGAHVLRAKVDLAAANMKMRDPLLYRIRHAHHYRTGDTWCIYPLYDFAHPLSDALEGITHSICTLEFENNRELYDWVVAHSGLAATPHQYEFARLNLNYTVMSKRKLLQLVEEKIVSGWDDPRMLTVAGMRRRGYTAEALRDFCDRIGVAKANSTVDMTQLEFSVRNDLNAKVPRVMAVLHPLKVVLENMPEGETEMLEGALYPHDIPLEGTRSIPFTREIYIDQSDFSENPPKGFYRLKPGGEVRLRHSYVIRCNSVEKDPKTGAVQLLRCTLDPETLGKNPTDRKVKGTIQWVSSSRSVACEMRMYDRLFLDEKPGADGSDFKDSINAQSLEIVHGFVEPSIAGDAAGTGYQFERIGYFCSDIKDSRPDNLVFNLTVGLKDGWTKQISEPQSKSKPIQETKTKESSIEVQSIPKAKSWSAQETRQLENYTQSLGIAREVAETVVGEPAIAAYLDSVLPHCNSAVQLANWIANEWMPVLREWQERELPFSSQQLGALVNLVSQDRISGATAKRVFQIMSEKGGDPEKIVADQGWEKLRDSGELEAIISQILAREVDAVERYRQGNAKLMGFFVGQVMKVTMGKADAKQVQNLVREKLERF